MPTDNAINASIDAIDQAISNLRLLLSLSDDPTMQTIIHTTADGLAEALELLREMGDE